MCAYGSRNSWGLRRRGLPAQRALQHDFVPGVGVVVRSLAVDRLKTRRERLQPVGHEPPAEAVVPCLVVKTEPQIRRAGQTDRHGQAVPEFRIEAYARQVPARPGKRARGCRTSQPADLSPGAP